MKRIQSSRFYFLSLSVVFIFAAILLMVKGHANSFLWLNTYHNKVADFVFYYCTYLGDGWFAASLSLLLLLSPKTRKLGLLLLIAYAGSGLLAQLVKHIVAAPRPSVYFTLAQYHKFVVGVELAGSNSFPSGHTTTAFALATIFASFTQNKKAQLLCLVLAVATGYSRIYLGQHFLTDVFVGALLGSGSSALTIVISEKINASKN